MAVLLAVFGSKVAADIVAVLPNEMGIEVPTPGSTRATRVNTALPMANDACVHETVPLAPTAGVVQLQPAGEVSETKLVSLASSVSTKVTEVASLPPALVAVIV